MRDEYCNHEWNVTKYAIDSFGVTLLVWYNFVRYSNDSSCMQQQVMFRNVTNITLLYVLKRDGVS